jgi:hypothetical protein
MWLTVKDGTRDISPARSYTNRTCHTLDTDVFGGSSSGI